jgi:hypothetical protein
MFYLALPPSVFESVTEHIRNNAWGPGINRVIIEKPFGRDSASSEVLSKVRNFLQRDVRYSNPIPKRKRDDELTKPVFGLGALCSI